MINDFKFHHFDEVSSTQDVAKTLLKAGEVTHATVITAHTQTHGRGRYNRFWLSPRGGLYLSICLTPQQPKDEWSQISYIMGVALYEAIVQIDPMCSPILKWVNDILLNDKKIAGILLEMVDDTLIIGVGVNLLSPSLEDIMELAIGLDKCSQNFTQEKLLSMVIKRFQYNYNLWCEKGFEPIRSLWMHAAWGLGKELEVRMATHTQKGLFIGIDEKGHLKLLENGVIRRVSAGEVFFT